MTRRPFHPLPGPARSAGLTLVELMIAMVLGLVVIGGVLAIVLANSQSYRSSEALSEIQESTRTAFELLARDIRQAGETGCGHRMEDEVVSALGDGVQWWEVWNGILGHAPGEADAAAPIGTGVAQRVAGTRSIHLQSITGKGIAVVEHDADDAVFTLHEDGNFNRHDLLLVCGFPDPHGPFKYARSPAIHTAIFAVSAYDPDSLTLEHDGPENCTKGLGPELRCEDGDEDADLYQFKANAQIARLASTAWYIGNNGRPEDGGRSLYRVQARNHQAPAREEIVAGISDMVLSYREGNESAFVEADLVNNWQHVNAVKITLIASSASDSNAERLSRSVTSIVTLRNRVLDEP